jgi:hypothetical protein
VVDEPVVIAAQQHEILQVGRSVVAPVPDVMTLTPAGRPITAGESATPVAEREGAAEGSGDQAGLPAEVEGLAGAAEEGGDDAGVAGDPSGLRG